MIKMIQLIVAIAISSVIYSVMFAFASDYLSNEHCFIIAFSILYSEMAMLMSEVEKLRGDIKKQASAASSAKFSPTQPTEV
jgi:hypothetical protein